MKRIKISKSILLKSILPAIILLQFILIGLLALYISNTRREVNNQPPLKISSLIISAIEGLTWPAPTDAKSGNIYIRETKLTLPPAPNHVLELYYNYFPSDGMPEEVRLINKHNVDVQKNKIYAAQDIQDVFDLVPKLQSCARGYLLRFYPLKDSERSGIKEVFTKKLSDGRTTYVYLENQCADNKASIIPYLKQIESY
jgi:hypothetical protein